MNFDQVGQRLKERAAKTILSTMKLKQRPDLDTLSEKKRVAMDCFVDAVESIPDLDWPVRRDWITWIFYTQRFLSDEQTDQFIKAMLISCNDYEFVFFTNELNTKQRSKLIQQKKIAPEIILHNPESYLM